MEIRQWTFPQPGCLVTCQGWKERMDDAACVFQLADQIMLYAVFDGYDGLATAYQAAYLLPSLIKQKLSLIDLTNSELVSNLLQESFLACNYYLYCQQFEPGSTVCLALLIKDKLYLANLGDSRAILFNGQGQLLFQTTDYNTDLGALGDFYRQPGNANYHCWTGCQPDIYIYGNCCNLSLCLATDGLWDLMSSSAVSGYLSNPSLSVKQKCLNLVNHCLFNLQSDDNITLLYVKIDKL